MIKFFVSNILTEAGVIHGLGRGGVGCLGTDGVGIGAAVVGVKFCSGAWILTAANKNKNVAKWINFVIWINNKTKLMNNYQILKLKKYKQYIYLHCVYYFHYSY